MAAPMSDADREAWRQSGSSLQVDGIDVVFADIDSALSTEAIERVANECLWFVHHGMVDLAIAPTESQWAAFREYGRAVARAVADAAPHQAIALVQDYHLPFVAVDLADSRPDIACVHFSHTPFADRRSWQALPHPHRSEITQAMARFSAAGFHSKRWQERFVACCEADDVTPPPTYLSALTPDIDGMRTASTSDAATRERSRLQRHREQGRLLIVRVDRLEPTKNVVRGFLALDELLTRRPDLRGAVVMAAYAYPSRSTLPIYQQLRDDVVATVEEVNSKWSTEEWEPIELDLNDSLEDAAAALTEFDVLLVNPVEDGLNLVAFEGAALNEQRGTIVLSATAGAADRFGEVVEIIDPMDIAATSAALERSLGLGYDERALRHRRARAVANRDDGEWLAGQIAAASR